MTDYMLIAGCSHSAGSEIDGNASSKYNREHSFGNLLAYKLGLQPINIAMNGSCNSTIARGVIEWFSEHKEKVKNNNVFVMINWTEPSRLEAPAEWETDYSTATMGADWASSSCKNYLQINIGHEGFDSREKEIQKVYKNFMVTGGPYFEVNSAQHILQMQYFCESRNVRWLMTNTAYMLTKQFDKWTRFYYREVDKQHYYKLKEDHESFYEKYRQLGYVNTKAKWGHHAEIPHALHAEDLYNFVKSNNI